jgi:FkbM family methyltransferase
VISYAQNSEDVVLMRAFADETNGFYIDVGAWDPVADSVTKVFYDGGWRGINIEPQPARCKLFEEERQRDTNLNVAISNAEGTATLLVTRFGPLSTLEPGVIDVTNPNYAIVDRTIVRTLTLAAVMDAYAYERTIHFLKVDVEGHEAAVLRGADFGRYRPIIVVVEAVCPTTAAPRWAKWETILTQAGYDFLHFDGLNRFYLGHERPDLRDAFS